MKKYFLLAILILALCFPLKAYAINASQFNIREEYYKEALSFSDMTAPFNSEQIQTKVNTYTGELELEITDLVLPGKNGLDVEIKRSYRSREDGNTFLVYQASSKADCYGRLSVLPYQNSSGRIYRVAFDSEDLILEAGESIVISSESTMYINDTLYYFYTKDSISEDKQINVTRMENAEVYTVDYDYESSKTVAWLPNIYSDTPLEYGWDYSIPKATTAEIVYSDSYDREYNNLLRDYDGNILHLVWDATKSNGEWKALSMWVENANGYSCQYLNFDDITDENGLVYNKTVTAPDGKKTYLNKRGYIVAIEDKFGNMMRFPEKNHIIDTMGRHIYCNSNGITYIEPKDSTEHKITFEKEGIVSPGGESFSSGTQIIMKVTYESGNTVKYYHTVRTNTYIPRQYNKSYTNKYSMPFFVNNLEKIEYPNGDCKIFNYKSRVMYMKNSGNTVQYVVNSAYDIINDEIKNQYEYDYSGNKYMGKPKNSNLATITGKTIRLADGAVITDTYSKSMNYMKEKTEIGNFYTEYDYSSYYEKPMIKYISSYDGIKKEEKSYTHNDARLPVNESDKHYTVNYTYDDTYNIMLTKAYNINDNTNVLYKNTLSDDKKTVVYTEVFVNDVLQTKIFYSYDSFGNLISQKIWANDLNNDEICDENELEEVKCSYVYNSDGTFSIEKYINNVVDCDGMVTDKIAVKYEYDIFGNPNKITDSNNNIYNYSYSITGKLLSLTSPDNTTASFDYDYTSNSTIYTNENGEKIKQKHDCYGNLLEKYIYKSNAWVLVEKNIYDNLQKLLTNTLYSEYNVINSVTYYTYDSEQRLSSIVIEDKEGTVVSEKNYNYISNIEKNGKYCTGISETVCGDTEDENITSTKYYFYGRLVAEETESNNELQITLYNYDKIGNLISKTLPNGTVLNYEYDYMGNIIKETNSFIDYPTERVYDKKGRLKKVIEKTTDGADVITEYSYDKLDRKIIENGNAFLKNYYDGNGNIIKTVTGSSDPIITQNTYNLRNKLVKSISGASPDVPVETSYTYDSVGNLLGFSVGTGENKKTTEYQYNELGQLIKTTDNSGKSESYTYDLLGNMLSKTDRNGIVQTNSYTAFGKPKVSINPQETVNYTYDKKGNLKSITGTASRVAYSYDGFGRIKSEIMINGGDTVTNNYTYDIMNNRTSYKMTRNGAEEISQSYSYDGLNRLTQMNGLTYSYYGNGLRHYAGGYSDGNTYPTEYIYDSRNRLYQLSDDPSVTNYYDDKGNLTEKRSVMDGMQYTYDSLGRLKRELREVDSEQCSNYTEKIYEYDEYGNRIRLKTRAYSSDNEIAPEFEITDYIYDASNRLIYENFGSERNCYTYDNNGNMLTKTRQNTETGEALDISGNAVYEYDKNGRMVKATIGTSVTEYSYYPDGRRATKNTDETIISHAWDGSNIVADTKNNELTKYIRSFKLEYAESGETKKEYRHNSHGDVYRFGDNKYGYDAFGNSYYDENISYNELPDPFGYCGEYYDNETGLIYLRNRYYNPQTGRFVSEDPVKDGVNWYVYCNNNPIKYIDPSGYITLEEINMYENGKMAPMAYSYLMNLTYQWYLTNDETSKTKYHQWAEDFRNNDYKTTNGVFSYVDKGIEYMPSRPVDDITEEQHFFRNQLNLQFSWNTFKILNERLPDNLKWKELSLLQSAFHKFGQMNNRKYVSACEHFEAVYTKENYLVDENFSDVNMGTYNYYGPTQAQKHNEIDVIPWEKWGNTKKGWIWSKWFN